jgi:hypothetical protein
MAKDKRTVFILGAGASCPYGYPSAARLRELICVNVGFMDHYRASLKNAGVPVEQISRFRDTFKRSHVRSIDLFLSMNPKLAILGKYIIAFEMLRSEKESSFAEDAKRQQEYREQCRSSEYRNKRDYLWGTTDFIGGDWYSYFYGRIIDRVVGQTVLPDFSGNELAFITFNYDRSLEHFLHESLSNLFGEVPEDDIVRCLNQLKIVHIYGQIAPLKWQDSGGGVDYRPQQVDDLLLERAAANLKTIYEQKASPELGEAREIIAQAERIFLLGFGYAPENMDVLGLPAVIAPECQVYGTAYGLIEEERDRVCASVHDPRKVDKAKTMIEGGDVDCLTLLRKHF